MTGNQPGRWVQFAPGQWQRLPRAQEPRALAATGPSLIRCPRGGSGLGEAGAEAEAAPKPEREP